MEKQTSKMFGFFSSFLVLIILADLWLFCFLITIIYGLSDDTLSDGQVCDWVFILRQE